MRGLDPRIHADLPQSKTIAAGLLQRLFSMDRRVEPGDDQRRNAKSNDTWSNCRGIPVAPRNLLLTGNLGGISGVERRD
jgi:hypothetical protein